MATPTTEIVPAVEKEEKALTKITNYMEAPAIQARFAKIMGERGASSYISSVLIAVADSWSLQKCTPVSIYTSALRAATLRLSVDPGVGQAYLVPFKSRATLIVGYKGLHDMAVRTNKYRYINAGPVYDGEEVVEDRLSGFHKIEGHRTSDTIIGWIAAFELYAGYAKTLYMTVEEIHAHAELYSPGYDYKDNRGEYTSLWKKEPAKMEKKTVLRLLLRRWGYIDPAEARILEEIEEEQPETIEAEFNTIAETLDKRSGPEMKHSQAASVAALMGEGNPDPIKDDTWVSWEYWKALGEKYGIKCSDVNRSSTTEFDLITYIAEVAPGIRDAEAQAAAA